MKLVPSGIIMGMSDECARELAAIGLFDQQAVSGVSQSEQTTKPRKGKSALMSFRAGDLAPECKRLWIFSKVASEISPSCWALRKLTPQRGNSRYPA